MRPEEARAWQDSHRYLAAAQDEAREIRDAARRVYATEYAKGYEAGKVQGETEAVRLLADTTTKVDAYLAGIRDEIAALVLAVTKEVLGDLDLSDLVARAAERAISELRAAKHLHVSLHPDAAPAVRERLSRIESAAFGFSIRIDASLPADACTITTDMAVIEAGIKDQLESISLALTADDGSVS